MNAINREKQIKVGSRKKKEDLINRKNPNWKDLFSRSKTNIGLFKYFVCFLTDCCALFAMTSFANNRVVYFSLIK